MVVGGEMTGSEMMEGKGCSGEGACKCGGKRKRQDERSERERREEEKAGEAKEIRQEERGRDLVRGASRWACGRLRGKRGRGSERDLGSKGGGLVPKEKIKRVITSRRR